ncbi:uncharacterized protein LOC121074512 [Cygnus olor]|uniref:uncharacterized protein LOC121074512 n=1 Tax=Cygnus olor TaxID=8869 RepID=UPI001ADE07D9|nr:uncharacterized protein LOC121074512 [Cygnus olor]
MEVLLMWSLTSASEKSTIVQGVQSIACISLQETWVLPDPVVLEKRDSTRSIYPAASPGPFNIPVTSHPRVHVPTHRTLLSSGDDTSDTQAPTTSGPQTSCLECVVPSSRKKWLELELNMMTGRTAVIRHRAQPNKHTDQQTLFRQLTVFVPLSPPLFSLAYSSSNNLDSSFSIAFVPALCIPQQALYNPKMLFPCIPVPQR